MLKYSDSVSLKSIEGQDLLEDLLKKFSKEHSFLSKEKLYSMHKIIHDDMLAGKKDDGVYTKAFVDAEGDSQKTKAIYIALMVERLILAEAASLEKSRKATRIQTPKPKKKSKSQEEEERKKKADEDWNKQFGLKKGNQNEKYKRDNKGSSYSYKQENKSAYNQANYKGATEYKTPKSEVKGLKSYHQKQIEAEAEAKRKNTNLEWKDRGNDRSAFNQGLLAFVVLVAFIIVIAIFD